MAHRHVAASIENKDSDLFIGWIRLSPSIWFGTEGIIFDAIHEEK